MATVGFEFEFATSMSDQQVTQKLTEYGIKVENGPGYSTWQLDFDVSIQTRKHHSYTNSCELISPPMRLSKALKMLDAVLKFMRENPVETNTTTGLHINMDIGSKATKRIDPAKLVTLVDDESVARRYKRSKQMYCLPHNSKIRQQARYYNNLKNKPCKLIDYIKQWGLTSAQLEEKYSAINFGKQSDDGFLEFRMIGNTNYQYRFREIVKDVRHFETCMRKAADKHAGNRAVVRRLNKMAA
jgi:hypothetical protein